MTGPAAPRKHFRMPATPPRPQRAILGFIARFIAGWVVLIALVAWVPALEQWSIRHTVASVARVAPLFHMSCDPRGANLSLGGTGIAIVPDCTPLMPIAALWIAILAFPASWGWRLIGMAGGAAALWLYNLLRIFLLVPVMRYRPRWFEFIHVYLWQTVTLLVVFALFMLWLRLQQPAVARA